MRIIGLLLLLAALVPGPLLADAGYYTGWNLAGGLTLWAPPEILSAAMTIDNGWTLVHYLGDEWGYLTTLHLEFVHLAARGYATGWTERLPTNTAMTIYWQHGVAHRWVLTPSLSLTTGAGLTFDISPALSHISQYLSVYSLGVGVPVLLGLRLGSVVELLAGVEPSYAFLRLASSSGTFGGLSHQGRVGLAIYLAAGIRI